MADKYNIEHRGDYISVKLGPDYEASPEQRDEFWGMLKEACSQFDCHSVLVEGVAPNPTRDPIGVVQSGEKASTVPKLWLAFCFDNYELTELGELFKAVARSRGAHVKFFNDREHALLWLRSGAAEDHHNV